MTARKKTAQPVRERQTYFSALTAENYRLAEEVKTLRGDNEALRAGMQAAAAAGDRQALNQELAAANISLVQKLREVLSIWEQERAAALQEGLHRAGQVRQLHEQLAAAEKKASGLEQENQNLKGELEGLQDVLAEQEQERTAMRQERVRLSDEVRRLNQQLAVATREAWVPAGQEVAA